MATQGGIKPAVRIQADLPRLAAYGLALEDIRQAIVNANVAGPKGAFDGAFQSYTIAANDQLAAAEAYRTLVIAYRNQNPVMLRDVAEVVDGLENAKVSGWHNGTQAVIIDIRRQPGANVVQTVQNIQDELPRLRRILPVGAKLTVVQDRTDTIRASIHDVQFTLVLAVGLVVLVVFIFLRTIRATIIAGVALPLSLIATFCVMWFAGFSLDNLSLMALTIGTGFVVDDAIVMIENIVRHMEEGEFAYRRRDARRARDRLHHHIADRLADRGVHPAAVHDRPCRPHVPRVRADADHRGRGVGDRVADADADDVREAAAPRAATAAATASRAGSTALVDGSVGVLRPQPRMGAAPPDAHAAADRRDLRGDDRALCRGAEGLPAAAGHRADHRRDRSRHRSLVRRNAAAAAARLRQDPAGPGRDRRRLGRRRQPAQCDAECRAPRRSRCARAANATSWWRRSSSGSSAPSPTSPGMTVYFQPVQDIQISTRPSRAQYQYTLVGTDAAEVAKWSDKLVDALRQNPTLRDVSSEAQEGGLRAFINVDREKAGRLGISMQVINDTLNDAFGQRQISTIYGQANQYRVILEAAPQYQRDPSALQKIYLPANIPSQPLQSSSAQNIQPLSTFVPGAIEHAGAARGIRRDDPHHRAARDRASGAVPLGDAQLQSRARRGARRCGRRSSRRPSASSACRRR